MSLATSSRSKTQRTGAARSSAGRRNNPLFQDIIVVQDDSAASLSALQYAQTLAASSDGNVTGIVFGMMAAYPVTVYAEALPSTWLALQEKADAEAQALEGRVAARIDKTLFASELRRINVMGGEAGRALASHAYYSDLVALGLSKGGGTDMEHRLFEGVLFGAGVPLVLVPEAFTPPKLPKRVVIAWRPCSQAARAVRDAMPILEAAEAVRVLVVDERGEVVEGDDPGADIARPLARHDIKVDVKAVPAATRGVARTIMDEARYFDADLLVMGGYGHSRTREWILGGATRDILSLTEVPILFSH
ncbi:MAG: universal stress protein [Beijerinckiaceae bacterium]